MARNVTLYELRTDIQEQADIKGSTTRYGSTLLNRLINRSRQKFGREISNAGARHLLQPASGTLSVGATSPHQFYELDLSATSPNMVAIYGIDVTISGERRTLLQIPFTQRSDWGSITHTGQPAAWAAYRTRVAAIFPAPDQAYAYTAWYLPSLNDLADDADTWDGVAGWEEFVVWDVTAALLARDNNQGGSALANQQAQVAFGNVIKSANRVTRGGSATVARDTFGERIDNIRQLKRWRLRQIV